MSLSRGQRIRLGAFMIIGCIGLVLFILIPLGLRLKNTYKTYYAFFEGESLSGLEQGANVKYHGIPIGKVEKLNYDPSNIQRVKVTFKVQHDFPMKEDMYAQTAIMGITGLMYLEILGGSNEANFLKDNSEIPTKRSTIATISGKADAIVAKVELLLNHLNLITNPDSLRSIKIILDNVSAISSDTREFISSSGPQLRAVATSMQALVQNLDSMSRDIKILTGELRGGLGEGQLVTIINHLDSAILSLNTLVSTTNMMIKQSKEDIMVAFENIRSASENANQLSQLLVENPSLLIRQEQQKQRDIR